MLAYLLGVLLFGFGAAASIALHEAGHLIAAKAFGMKVRRYFIGFGPRMFSFRRGETEYGMKWIPFGGFCEIAGMTTLDELTPAEKPRAMWRFKAWQRTVVMGSGIAVNLLVGFVVLCALAVTMGLPNLTGTPQVTSVSACVRDARTADEVAAPACAPGDPAPAWAAGIRPGDEIVSVAGRPTPTYVDVISSIQRASGPTAIAVERDGQVLPLTVDVPRVDRPQARDGGPVEIVSTGSIGVNFPREFHYDPLGGIAGAASFAGNMVAQTWQRLLEFPEKIPAVAGAILGGERDPEGPVSVVGMSRIGGEAVEQGLWQLFLLLLAGLNFFLAVFNMVPLLPLDGGHIAVVWYERLRNRIRALRGRAEGPPVDYTRLSTVTLTLVLIGGAVMLLTITADIVNPVRLT